MSKFVSNSLFGALASLTTTLSGLACNLLIAHMLGVEGTGEIAIAAWIAATAATVFGLGIPATMARYLPTLIGNGHIEESRQVVGNLFRVLLTAMAIPVVMLLCLGFLPQSASAPLSAARADFTVLATPESCALIAMLCASWGLVEFVRSYYRGVQAFRRLATITTASALFQIFALIVAVKLFGVSGALGSFILGALVVISALAWIRPSPSALPTSLRPRLRTYAFFRWASEINATFVWSRIEVFFLQLAGGAVNVGLFTAGLTLVNLAIQGIQMLSWGLLPHFSEQYGQGRLNEMRTSFETVVRIMALATFPMCLGLAAILPEFLPVLFGKQFAEAIPSSIILVVGAMLIGPGTVAITVSWAMERSDVEFSCGILSVGVAIFGGLVLVPKYGLIGAAVSRVCTQLTFVVSCNIYLMRKMHFRLPIVDLGAILVAALLCASSARLSLTLLWPGASGLPSAVILGAMTYALALRLLQVVRAEEVSRLANVTSSLPYPLAAASRAALRFVGDTH